MWCIERCLYPIKYPNDALFLIQPSDTSQLSENPLQKVFVSATDPYYPQGRQVSHDMLFHFLVHG